MPRKSKQTTLSRATAKGGRPAEVGRFFRGLPVVDATAPITIVVNRQDIKSAHRLDPNNCVFAQACRRLFNSTAVLFLRKTAYVELPDKNGYRQVNRFQINPSTMKQIITYDKTGEAAEGGFTLSPPSRSRTMEAHRAYSIKYRNDVYYGRHVPTRTRRPSIKYLKTMEGVRDGRGKLGINYGF